MTRIYRGRTPDEQRAFNKQRREELKLAKQQAGNDFDIATALNGQFHPDIKVEPIEVKKQSLKDRLFSRFKQDEDESPVTAKSSKEHIQRSDDLFSHILPITLAGLLAIYTEKLFVEPYKAVSPTKEEYSTILLPLFAIFTRYVHISGKASQTAIDAWAILLAIITISTRMLITVQEISYHEQATKRVEKRESDRANSTRTRNSTQSFNGTIRDFSTPNGTEYNRYDEDAYSTNQDNGANRDSEDGWNEANQVAQLLRRDTYGRRAMGYAPRFIQPEDDRDIQ